MAWSFRAARLAEASGAEAVAHCSLLFSGAGGGSPPPDPGTLLQTRTLVNPAGSATATNSLTDSFQLRFKKGDVPTGDWPVLQTSGGTNVPYSYWGKATWSDGSLKVLNVLPRFPDAITGSGTASLKVYNGGSAPASSARTLAELAAANITIEGVGWDSTLSGTWTLDVSTAISDAVETVVIGEGPTCKYWRILGNFKQSGNAHGQLVCHLYVFALTDSSGNLAGFRLMPRNTQPYYNVASPAADRRNFSSLVLKVGGSTVCDPVANSYSAKTFTWVSGTTFRVSGGHGFRNSTPVQASNSGGSLPGGLSAATTYFVNPINSTDLQLRDVPTEFGSSITGTSAGTGTHTLTPGNMVSAFGTAWIATTEGKYVYVQGGGSIAADPGIRCQMDKTYEKTAKVLPPYDQTIGTVPSNSSYPWAPQSIGPLTAFVGGTGEREDIGCIPTPCVRHFYTQAAVDELMVRTIGLSQANVATHFRDNTTKGPVNLGDPGASYTGMPSSLYNTFKFRPSVPVASGFTAPASAGWNQVFSSNTMDHFPHLAVYAYALTGEWQYYDLMVEAANQALMAYDPADRNITVGGTTYYGVGSSGRDTFRAGAWSGLRLVVAAGFAPDTSPDGKGITQYVKDRASSMAACMVAHSNAQSSWWTTNGFWHPPNHSGARSSWQMGYEFQKTCWHAMLLEDTNAIAMMNHFTKWPVYIKATYGNLWILTTYYESSSSTAGAQGTPYITSEALWGAEANNVSGLSWDATTDRITWSSPNWTPANGDKIIFWEGLGASTPGGLTAMTAYYAVQTSGNTQKLSATPGGSALDITNTASLTPDCRNVLVTVANPSASGGISDSVSTASYGSNYCGAMCWAEAEGSVTSGLSAATTELLGRLAAVDYTGDPKYKMARTH